MKWKGKLENCILKACVWLNGMLSGLSVRFKKSIWLRTAAVFLALLLGLAGGIYVYAKYYSISAKEGIAIATGVYFTANYAAASTTELDENGNQIEEFVESLVNTNYLGDDASFTFEVHNYENNLLFNSENVDIPYTVEFWLEKKPIDGTYSVSVGEDGNASTFSEEEDWSVKFTDQIIEGGAARANAYKINVEVPNDITHDPVAVYVRVKTIEGSLVNRTLTGKMVLGNAEKAESYIESQQFVVPEKDADEGKFEALKKLSGFTYEIRTVGEVTSSGELTEKLTLSWDPRVLQIDLFDEAYLEWLAGVQKEDPSIKGPIVETDGEKNGWYSITIQAMPYSSETIGFFRGSEFGTYATDWTTLHNYIEAEKYTTSS